jgi:hypothetical protein
MNCCCESGSTHHHVGRYHKFSDGCSHGLSPHFLSKKKKVEALKQYLAEMHEKAKDIEAYIIELEKKD